MIWSVVFRPEIAQDVTEAADWYDARQEGLGRRFREEVVLVFDGLALNPLLGCLRHPSKNIRWRYPARFPYRVIYEVLESERTVVVAAVLHAARHDQNWRRRFSV